MPLATLAGIPAFIGLHSLYSWTHPAPSLGNTFYLNTTGFFLRYAIYVVLWNMLAAFALWAPRGEAAPIAPSLSWLSGIGLIAARFFRRFCLDRLDYVARAGLLVVDVSRIRSGAGWFNTGLALVLLVVAVSGPAVRERRDHMADLAAILLATTIFWAYVEFMQFLIIWEENLKSEIPWYLLRIAGVWKAALYVSVGFGFVVPFFVLLWRPSKRSRAIVATICSADRDQPRGRQVVAGAAGICPVPARSGSTLRRSWPWAGRWCCCLPGRCATAARFSLGGWPIGKAADHG